MNKETLIYKLRKGEKPTCGDCVWFGRHNNESSLFCREHVVPGFEYVHLKSVEREYPACSRFIQADSMTNEES